MDVKEYIASGILELYVAGALNEEQNLEVQEYASQYPAIKEEIELIEVTILELTKSASPGLSTNSFERLKEEISGVNPVTPDSKIKTLTWSRYVGWAAALLFGVGLLWMYSENKRLNTTLDVVTEEKNTLEDEIIDIKTRVVENEDLINKLRNQKVAVIALKGQTVSPESYAKVYWNKEDEKVLIDAQGLPEPPKGYMYQVWSLKLNPLTPTSIGLLDDFVNNTNLIFEFNNPNDSEAFGITLEPAGGNDTPTLEQLYTFGTIGA